MTKNKSILLIMSTILAFMISLAVTTVARAEEPPPIATIRGLVNETGLHFEVIDSDYLNVTLDSSETISLTLHSFPNQVIVAIRPVSEASSTQVTLSGLTPSTTFYKYEDAAEEPVTFTTDAGGNYAYTQDLAAEHLVRIQPNRSTWLLNDEVTGGQCTFIGSWNATAKTCTLTTDVTETIQITANNITLDGAGHTIDYPNTGIFLGHASGVTIKNLNITGSTSSPGDAGIILFSSGNNIIEGVNIFNKYWGMYIYNNSSNNTYHHNTFFNNRTGVYEHSSYTNTYHHNTFFNNARYGMILNAVYYHTIYNNDFLDNSNQVYDHYAGRNTWNLAAPDGGNYYGHYDTPVEGCEDINSDGFCDAALAIVEPGVNVGYDYLPLTSPANNEPPTAAASQSPAANGLGWNNTDVIVTWNWSDEAGGSGIDNAACTTSSTSTGEGELTLYANCKDMAGNEGSASYTVLVDKTLPVADAGLDQPIHAGDPVNLDGGASSDDNTLPEALSYGWSFFSTPAGNSAIWNNDDTATPSFTPNVSGEYVAQLIVTDDADNASEPTFVTLSSLNMAPTADATATPMLPLLGQTVSLDGTASSDPDYDTISYLWTVASKPVGSAALLTNATSAIASITPDVSGTYEMTLTVSDFLESGTAVTVSFVASTAEDLAQFHIISASNSMTALEPGEITTAGNQNAFGNFLTNTMSQIQKGKIDKAIADLEKAIARTDGCALRGAPDGNGAGMDWVTTCSAQATVYDSLVAALQALQN